MTCVEFSVTNRDFLSSKHHHTGHPLGNTAFARCLSMINKLHHPKSAWQLPSFRSVPHESVKEILSPQTGTTNLTSHLPGPEIQP